METLPIILLILGTILICIEMFLPGFGICGIAGTALVIASGAITIATVPYGLFIVLAQVSAVAIVIYAAFVYAKRKQLHSKIILDETLAEDVNPIGGLEFFLGKEGVTRTPLRPFGEGVFNGASLQVVSDGSYIPENTRVKVTSVDGQRVLVAPVNNN
ncbi:MAG: hypothetical protein FWE68_02955 [Defluviitaleaceae bacterium]|nr:hypothetical protein [Defluviitaleaceae bacterium]